MIKITNPLMSHNENIITDFLIEMGIDHQDIDYKRSLTPLDHFSFKCHPALAMYLMDECFEKIFNALGFHGCMTISGPLSEPLVTMQIDMHNFQREDYEVTKNLGRSFVPPDDYKPEVEES